MEKEKLKLVHLNKSKIMIIIIFTISFLTVISSIIIAEIMNINSGHGNTLRFFTYQGNLITLMIYGGMLLGIFYKPFTKIWENYKIRLVCYTIMSGILAIILFVLLPLFILNIVGIGPGSYGFDKTIPPWSTTLDWINDFIVNIFLHFLLPILVMIHFAYDRMYIFAKSKEWKGNVNYSLQATLPFILFYIYTLPLFFYDGWAPYSIMNPNDWELLGWWAVALWTIYSALILVGNQFLLLWLERKYFIIK